MKKGPILLGSVSLAKTMTPKREYVELGVPGSKAKTQSDSSQPTPVFKCDFIVNTRQNSALLRNFYRAGERELCG